MTNKETMVEAKVDPVFVLPILKFFNFEHLPPTLAEISRPFCELARKCGQDAIDSGRVGAETSAGLRKLLEAKDCFVRAALEQT